MLLYKFANNDINKFILLLRKCVYPNEYMDDLYIYMICMFILEFSFIGIWFTDQNSKPLEIEDKISWFCDSDV